MQESSQVRWLICCDSPTRKKVKVKKVRFHIAQYPVCRTTQSALHFILWQTCSFQHQLGFYWKHSATLHTARRLFTHISTAVYSQVLIYRAEWTEASWRTKMHKLRNGSIEPRFLCLRVRHSELPCSKQELTV